MRRDPEAILAAHKIDPERRELYVEGITDRAFFEWLAGEEKHPNARVLTAETVDLPSCQGGERGRLLHFAELVEESDAQIRFVADADFDRLLGQNVPQNVWLTDTRDLDGYLLSVVSIEKLMKLALGECICDPGKIQLAVLKACRPLGVLRFVSNDENLKLPFQKTKIQKIIHWDLRRSKITLNLQRHIQSLLQNAGISLRAAAKIRESMDVATERFRDRADHELVHGKDAIGVIAELLNAYGVPREVAFPALRATFERSYAQKWPNLKEALGFLCA
jgi:hypothetical protein